MPQTIDPPSVLDRFTVFRELFHDTHIIQAAIVGYRMQTLARRMTQFGFEEYTNLLTPRELLMLASFFLGMQQRAIIKEAYARADETLKAWIEKKGIAP